MKLSFNWLGDYVEHGLDAEAVANLLTMSGLEVEDIEQLGVRVDGIVVGHVLETRQHPNADRLTLCSVAIGEEEPVQIVCGAPNVAAGQKVPVATLGTTLMLPDRNNPGSRTAVTISKAKLRGETSEGMICSESELGLGEDHSGILVLGESAEVGESFSEYMTRQGHAGPDTRIEIAVTPNRPDATSHIGVARDVAAVTGGQVILPEVPLPTIGGKAASRISVSISDSEGCHRYAAMLVEKVQVAPSPIWLQERLRTAGLRPINNIVDITNYVMFEMGQPLHAFDASQVATEDNRHTIVVRSAEEGERMTTLDGKERTLPAGTLLIADPERPLAVAGVMGGENSEVTETTTTVLIESAYFDPVRVRRTAKRLGVQTDSSYRFERGIDPTAQLRAAARAAHLMTEIAGGTVIDGAVDEVARPYQPRHVSLRPSRLRRVLGTAVPEDEVIRLLTAIGFEVDAQAETLDSFAESLLEGDTVAGAVSGAAETTLNCLVPPFRPDVTREIDIIEEVARLSGFDQIPEATGVVIPLRPATRPAEEKLANLVRDHLSATGFREVYANSLLSAEMAAAFSVPLLTGVKTEVVNTLNPISQEMAVLRPSMLPGLLEIAAYNRARGAEDLLLFELGHVFGRGEDASALVKGYREYPALGIRVTGSAAPASWARRSREADLLDLRGAIELLFGRLGLTQLDFTPDNAPGAVASEALVISHMSQRLGAVGRLSLQVAESYDLRGPVLFAELDWRLVASIAARKGTPTYRPVPRFPAVSRDLAVTVSRSQGAGPVLNTIREAGGQLLGNVELFDVYAGERIESDKKSLAFALRFQADRTLTDEEVDADLKRILTRLQTEFGAELRS
ncbi:phenylalanine--tRNA ligase subunit beta [soil metagenome]